jgi:hypothetical protein
MNIIFLLHFQLQNEISSCSPRHLAIRHGCPREEVSWWVTSIQSMLIQFLWIVLFEPLRYLLTFIIFSIILLTDDLLWYVLHGITVYMAWGWVWYGGIVFKIWYVLHGITVFMDWGCVWYGAIVFKIWYVVMCITWYHRIHGLRMHMIRCYRI